MIGSPQLLSDCKALVKELENDIRDKAQRDDNLLATLEEQHKSLIQAKQTASTYGAWLDENVTQSAVAWVLSSVFIRFMEDNGLIDEAWISGPVHEDAGQDRLRLAKNQRNAYFGENPVDSDLQYLQFVFRQTGTIPACKSLFDEQLNPLWQMPVSAEGATKILEFWQELDADSGLLLREMETDDVFDTRFLGDLYQDLSEDARKRYALLQTPDFVEEFILDYTLTPAIETFGLDGLRMIDPTCGSGHFLLGAFKRILAAWEEEGEVSMTVNQMVWKSLESVHGIDLNPFAVAISRFRLMVAALVACDRKRLLDLPSFKLNLAVGDSLLDGKRFSGQLLLTDTEGETWSKNWLVPAEAVEANRILSQQYHAVAGNPPYIDVEDAEVRKEIKNRYESCFRKWTLSIPFTERFFDIAFHSNNQFGFVGFINSNNFTKREFGKVLIESILPRYRLTHVIDTSSCYIPGHGTPTIILFGTTEEALDNLTVRSALKIKGEGETPSIPSEGKVWKSIENNISIANTKTEWVSIKDVISSEYKSHPWNLSGDGKKELFKIINTYESTNIKTIGAKAGKEINLAEDNCFVIPRHFKARYNIPTMPYVAGANVRDWNINNIKEVIFPYSKITFEPLALSECGDLIKIQWPLKTTMKNRVFFGKTPEEAGKMWHEYSHFDNQKASEDRLLVYSEVSTHNHFSIVKKGMICNIKAPVIHLKGDVDTNDFLRLVSIFNSSLICFWLKERCSGKHMGDGGEAHSTPEYQRFEFNSTNVSKVPLTDKYKTDLSKLAELILSTVNKLPKLSILEANTLQISKSSIDLFLMESKNMIYLQEELDWLVYQAYGILTPEESPLYYPDDIIPLELGQRAFEINLARQVGKGEKQTSWFTRHRSTPITEIPDHWPVSYKEVVQRRIKLIEEHPHIALIEKPECKRRWAREPWEETVKKGLYEWLCDRLETEPIRGTEPELITIADLSDQAFTDPEFKQVANLYRGNEAYDQSALIDELIKAESVPYLPAMRYTDSGLRKREDWETTWELQRKEDAGENVGDIPVPPRYASKDFKGNTFWKHRGKLDVPKERFISYPGAEKEGDSSMVVLWAGFNHLEQAQALSNHILYAREEAGWPQDRITPLLAGLDELIPWLKQWHNDIDPNYGDRMGNYFEGFLQEEMRANGVVRDDLKSWRPPEPKRTTRKRKR